MRRENEFAREQAQAQALAEAKAQELKNSAAEQTIAEKNSTIVQLREEVSFIKHNSSIGIENMTVRIYAFCCFYSIHLYL